MAGVTQTKDGRMIMTKEDKQLLLADLCARLPYGVKVTFAGYSGREDCTLTVQHLNSTYNIEYLGMKPYLRPMSSMTEEEKDEYHSIQSDIWKPCGTQYYDNWHSIDWLNAHHFDFRNLIEKGLALEAPEGMY